VKHWQPREIELLARLRTRFLQRTAGESDYWHSDEELALYDATFAARIGWKIDAVLRAVQTIGWSPKSRRLLDWGCGSGIASRCVLSVWPQFGSAAFHDRSARAVAFAKAQLRVKHPRIALGDTHADGHTLLLVSHVLSELDPTQLDELLAQIRAAGEVIWVEAGTSADSRRLIDIRERLLAEASPLHVVAPCTHQARCGLLAPENERHWCHHYADPPQEVFRDARWEEWSRELGIDRRALPYSYLVLTRHEAPATAGCGRIIGVPREGKGHCRILGCDASGVSEFMVQKRDAPELFRALAKEREWPPFQWQIDNGKVVTASPFAPA
jgi:ribosomal protein RSM22 (predicted rRNA methylase)